MRTFTTDCIRNVALIGHSGEGKTSLAEAMLFQTKTIDRLGRTDDGTSTMDYDDEEIRRKISISMSLSYAVHNDTKINILDVPGFFDFEGEMVAALTAADSAVVVTSASGGLTVGTEKALDMCSDMKTASFIFVNAIDKDNSDFFGTVKAIVAKYPKVVPIELPIMVEGKMAGFVDVFSGKGFANDGVTAMDVPAELEAQANEFKGALMEMVAETDEELMTKFFDGGEFTADEIRNGVHAAISNETFIPLMAGNAITCLSVTRLMDKIVDLLPNPTRANHVKAIKNGEEIAVECNEDAPFSAQVFKSVVDPYVGKLLIFKVVTGKISSGDAIYNNSADKPEKVGTIYTLKGKKQEPVDFLVAGDIGALAKLVYTSTNDTLSAPDFKVDYEKINFPLPVISYAVSAVKDEEKAIQGLIKMQEEDATFKVEKNVETSDVLISGLGEAQLDIMCKRVKNKLGMDIILQEPKVAYRETIRKTAEAEGKHKKQSGGAGQYGDVFIRFEPGAADGEFEFVDAIVGGSVPRQFIPAVEKGLREAIKRGVLAGYPMTNLKATLYDGKYHPVDSKEIAFVTAAKLSYNDGLPNASPCFLEPIVEAKIVVPDSYLGDILGDMNKRRGRIIGTDTENGKQVITAEAPQAEMFRYATDLRSMTQGKGKFTMHIIRYDEVPAMANAKIIEDAKKREEEAKK
ncbi:MAG: elongation factor G [Clostridia bacterium]